MAHKFLGAINNLFGPETGINLVLTGIDEKIIIGPGSGQYFEKDQAKKSLTIMLTPSSGNTEPPRQINVQVSDCTHKITTQPTRWEVEITAEGDQTASLDVAIFKGQ